MPWPPWSAPCNRYRRGLLCIINVGHDVVEKPPFFRRSGTRTVIHVNFSSAEVDAVDFPLLEVVGDDAYGMIRWKLQDIGLPDFGLDFGNPDFVRYAESYGACGHRIEKAAELEPRLRDCLSQSGVHLIDCPIDYSDSQHELMEAIPARSEALSL